MYIHKLSVSTQILEEKTYIYTLTLTLKHACTHSGVVVELSVGSQAFDAAATPVAAGQVVAAPILVFRFNPGTIFNKPVPIAIKVCLYCVSMRVCVCVCVCCVCVCDYCVCALCVCVCVCVYMLCANA